MKFKLPFALFLLGLSACGPAESPKSSDATSSVLFLGDTHFGESYHVELDDRYTMDQFSALLDGVDLTIANLETPLTTLTESPYESEKDYVHWSDPELATDAFEKYGFDAFSLGNNHSMDFGEEGLKETLDAGGAFEFFGAGENLDEASQIFESAVTLPTGSDFELVVLGGFEEVSSYEAMGFYATESEPGVNPLTESTLESIRSIKQENPSVFVVVFPHWGSNYKMKNSDQEEWAHAFVDAGADLVLGHGAHLFQEVEMYEGKTIVYGLGNFIFKAQGRYQKLGVDAYSVAARLMVDSDGKVLRLYPLFCDNLVTDYTTRFVSEDEFEDLSEREDLKGLATSEDEIGFYFEIPLE